MTVTIVGVFGLGVRIGPESASRVANAFSRIPWRCRGAIDGVEHPTVSFREFRDESGTRWEVWEVQPPLVERRLQTDHPIDVDRRVTARKRAPVADDLRFGWLVFQAGDSKRRLAPVPRGWASFDDSGLRDLLGRATVRHRPGLVLSGDEAPASPPVSPSSPGPA